MLYPLLIVGVLKSPTIILSPTSPLRSVSICLLYFGAWVLGVYIFMIMLSRYNYPSYYITNFFVSLPFRLCFSDLSVVMPTFFCFLFAGILFSILWLGASVSNTWVSCRQHIVGSYFYLIHPVTLAFSLVSPIHLHLVITDRKNLLSFYLLPSACLSIVSFSVSVYLCEFMAFHGDLLSLSFYVLCLL